MARTPQFTLPARLASLPSRKFTITEAEGKGQVETPGTPGANEMICIHFTAPTKVGSLVNISANINPNEKWDSAHAHGLPCVIAINDRKGDVSRNVVASGSSGGFVGLNSRGQIRLEPGAEYWANVTPEQENAGVGMRVLASFSS